jgi:CRISPR-associated DxTHG motif protein
MKLLSFLGTGNYSRVTYRWDSHQYKTDLFPEALAAWKKPTEMLVMLTTEAKQHPNWATLQARLAGKVTLTPVDIPSGKSEAELWQIFEKLTGCLDEGDEVVFDVTHAFRSLPILALLAAAYLRVAKGVQLQSVLYGAFEAKDDNYAPVFDLTPFLALLDWVTATDKFVKMGDAQELAGLLKAAHRLPWQSISSRARNDLPRRLQDLGTTLANLSQALLLSRPHEVAEHAATLQGRLDTAAVEVERWAQPFVILLQRTRSAFEPFAIDTLAAQRELVHWYVERGQITQAVTLAREWLVSWAGRQLGKTLIAERDSVEDAINHAAWRKRGKVIEDTSSLLPRLTELPEVDTLVSAWGATNDFRNDVTHCGMREQPRSVASIVRSAMSLVERLDALSLPQEVRG